MRLFVALEIPPAVRENLAGLIRDLRAIAPQPKWVRVENLHITLKFIGEVADTKLEAIRQALGEVRSEAPVTLDFRGLGFFPNEKYPRVFWAGMEASANLKGLAADIDRAMEKLGIPREQRPFSPHLTLARFQPPGLPELPRTTPHSLRRTYISIALRANDYDVKFVMAQVGHADSKMTIEGRNGTVVTEAQIRLACVHLETGPRRVPVRCRSTRLLR